MEIFLKRCTKCGIEQPATFEFFRPHPLGKNGLQSRCRECQREYQRQKNKTPEQKAYNAARYRSAEYKELNRQRSQTPEYQQSALKRSRKPEIKASRKNRRHIRHEKILEGNRKRRSKQHNLPDTFTREDWLFALSYFNGCCAACGRNIVSPLGNYTAAKDHWIPVTAANCPGTIATNIVPLCHGYEGCNNSKHNRMPKHWLYKKFSLSQADQILERIEDYFQIVKEGAIHE